MTFLISADHTRHTPLPTGRWVVSLRTLMLTLLALALIPAMFFMGQAKANAHDVLVDQSPQVGEVLTEAPDEIVLSFNNNLLDVGTGATIITVSDATGVELDLGEATVSGRDARLQIDDLDDGAYHVVWSVVSSDGHRIANQFVFGVGSDSADAVAELEATVAAGADEGEASHEHGDDEAEHSHEHEAAASDGLSTGAVVGISAGAVAVAAVAVVAFWRKAKHSGK